LRLTDPASGAEQWHRLFPDDPLGTYPHKSLAEARAEARRLWSTRSSGVDPRAERQRQIRARENADAQARLAIERHITVRALFDRWAATALQPRVLLTARGSAARMAARSRRRSSSGVCSPSSATLPSRK
jgi:Arm DNA-binding domain